MEAILGAIFGALTSLAEPAIKDAYEGLKSVIKKRFGNDSDVLEAIQELEAKPDSEARKAVVKEELDVISAGEDPDVVAAASQLVERIREVLPDGEHIINTVTQNVSGTGHLFTGTGDVNVSREN